MEKSMKIQFNKERAKGNLKDILDKMHGDTDIVQLREYYKLYKKEVSLFKRSLTAAWLFMYYDKLETPRIRDGALDTVDKKTGIKSNKRQTGSFNKSGAEKPLSVPPIPEEESKRLFISIGKNRRLYPREVITLIMSKTSAQREDIGMIRILDNYSFVQVRDTKADEIIETLTGLRFRDRTLTVNYAKSKNAEPENESALN